MPDNKETMLLIEEKLRAKFSPTHFELIDESHLHAGHAGAQSGKGHFAIIIKSADFSGRLPIARHKMIYAALGELMQTHVHALSIKATA